MIDTLQFACCLYMTGVIWVIQLVHYPSFRYVDRADFSQFSVFHSRVMSWVVMPVMLLELGTGCWLFWLNRGFVYGGNLGGIMLIWFCTFALSVPCHNRLSNGYDEMTVERLIRTNWPRTILWSARAILLLLLRVG